MSLSPKFPLRQQFIVPVYKKNIYIKLCILLAEY